MSSVYGMGHKSWKTDGGLCDQKALKFVQSNENATMVTRKTYESF